MMNIVSAIKLQTFWNNMVAKYPDEKITFQSEVILQGIINKLLLLYDKSILSDK